MKIIALDTSTEYCSVALWIDGDVAARDVHAGQRHSEMLLPMIDELLRAHALRVRDIDGIAYGEGPGTFTGLRIACGVVQGLAFGAGLPVVGIGTLLAMAEGTKAARVVCCVDARMQEIYHGAFSRGHNDGQTTDSSSAGNELPITRAARAVRDDDAEDGSRSRREAEGWRAIHEPSVCAPTAAPALEGQGWHACGSGFRAYGEALEQRYEGQLAVIAPDHYPHAADIARLAVSKFEAGETLDAESAAPVYLRNKVALRSDERSSR